MRVHTGSLDTILCLDNEDAIVRQLVDNFVRVALQFGRCLQSQLKVFGFYRTVYRGMNMDVF